MPLNAPLPSVTLTRNEEIAQRRVMVAYFALGSWRATGEKLGFNKGYLNAVGRGRKRASLRLLETLKIRKKKHYGQKRRNWMRCALAVWGILWGESSTTSPETPPSR